MTEPKSTPRSSDHPHVREYVNTLDEVRAHVLKKAKKISIDEVRRKVRAVRRKKLVTRPPVEEEILDLPTDPDSEPADQSLAG